MSWFKSLVFVLVLSLAACGFQPLHGQGSEGTNPAARYAEIYIDNIPDKDGQYLRNQLIDRLYTQGRPQNARYTLKMSPLQKDIVDIGIRKDATSTRGRMEIKSTLQLIDNASGQVVLQRDMHSVGAYNQLDNQFATLISRENLTENILKEMSNNILTQINLFLREPA